jgi:hypothetical protein
LRRKRWNPLQNFQIGGVKPRDLARHLVLTGGELLHSLPQHGQTPRYLLQLLRVEGGGNGRFRRDRLLRSLRNG